VITGEAASDLFDIGLHSNGIGSCADVSGTDYYASLNDELLSILISPPSRLRSEWVFGETGQTSLDREPRLHARLEASQDCELAAVQQLNPKPTGTRTGTGRKRFKVLRGRSSEGAEKQVSDPTHGLHLIPDT
jgi:hypothetical protein